MNLTHERRLERNTAQGQPNLHEHQYEQLQYGNISSHVRCRVVHVPLQRLISWETRSTKTFWHPYFQRSQCQSVNLSPAPERFSEQPFHLSNEKAGYKQWPPTTHSPAFKSRNEVCAWYGGRRRRPAGVDPKTLGVPQDRFVTVNGACILRPS